MSRCRPLEDRELGKRSADPGAPVLHLTLLSADAAFEAALRHRVESAGHRWRVERRLHCAHPAQPTRNLLPEVVLFDTWSATNSGIASLRRIQRSPPPRSAIVLSNCTNPQTVLAALAAGARGYLRQPAPAATVIRAVEKVLCGEPVLCPHAIRALVDLINNSGRTAPHGPLSALDFDLLDCFSRGLSDKEVSRALSVCPGTVHSRTARIFAKLGVHTRAHAAQKLLKAERVVPCLLDE